MEIEKFIDRGSDFNAWSHVIPVLNHNFDMLGVHCIAGGVRWLIKSLDTSCPASSSFIKVNLRLNSYSNGNGKHCLRALPTLVSPFGHLRNSYSISLFQKASYRVFVNLTYKDSEHSRTLYWDRIWNVRYYTKVRVHIHSIIELKNFW